MVNRFVDDSGGRDQMEMGMNEREMYERFDGPPPPQMHDDVAEFFEHHEGIGVDMPHRHGELAELRRGNFDEMLARPAPPIQQEAHIHDVLKSFFTASVTQQPIPLQKVQNLSLPVNAKQKLTNRLGVLSRHCNPEQQAQDLRMRQLETVFESLNVNEENQRQVDGWVNDFRAEQTGGRWANEFQRKHRHPTTTTSWTREWERDRWADRPRPALSEADTRQFTDAWEEGATAEDWREEYENNFQEDKLREKILYAKYLESLTDEQCEIELKRMAAEISTIEDPALRETKFMEMMTMIAKGKLQLGKDGLESIESTGPLKTNEKEEIEEIEGEEVDSAELDAWLQQYKHFERPEYDFTEFQKIAKLARMRSELQADEQEAEFGDLGSLDDFFSFGNGWAKLGEYDFAADNPFLNHPNPLQKGKELFQRGELSDAILAFEAVVQKDASHSEAWMLLGDAHAENDRDDKAISALKQATRADEGNLRALMSLAVSCTNETFKEQALMTLKSWLQKHPKYKQLVPASEDWVAEYKDEESLHREVTSLFLRAARLQPRDPDPDVQICLGLLFNISSEYDKAVDCFKTALRKRGDDYQLWNKLGATLANSTHSKEALGPYYKSLAIKPTYTRARANMGISYLNLEMYEDAATQFLACLAIQPAARHIWMNLQAVFAKMERDDLLDKSLAYDVEQFRGEFDF